MLLNARMTSRLARLLWMLLLVLGGCDCGYHTHSADGAADAWTDAPVAIDAPSDTALDSPHDAPFDVRADAADPDARSLGCDPGWHPLPSIPDDLEVLYAENPGCLLNVEWVSCGAGCQRLADDPRFERTIDPNSAWIDGDRAFFSVVEWMKAPTVHPGSIILVASTDGVVHGAWLDTSSLFHRPDVTLIQGFSGAAGAFGLGIIAGQTNADGNYRTFHALIYHAPILSMSEAIEPSLQLDTLPPGNGLQYIHASATTFTAEVQPLAEMLVVEHGVAHSLGGRDSATPYIPQASVLIGREVFWLDWNDGWKVRIAHGNFDMESEVFYELADGDILSLASDGHDLAWVQGYEPNDTRDVYSRMELWTAPVVTNPADLRPRLVTASYTGSNAGMLADGSYFTNSGAGVDTFDQVYSMSDGSVRSWHGPVGWLVNTSALWSRAGEVAYGGRMSARAQGTLFRLRMDEVFHPGVTLAR